MGGCYGFSKELFRNRTHLEIGHVFSIPENIQAEARGLSQTLEREFWHWEGPGRITCECVQKSNSGLYLESM